MSPALQQRAADGGCSAATAPAAAAAGHSEPSKVGHHTAGQGLKQSRPVLAAQRPKGPNPVTTASRGAKRAPDSSTSMPAKKSRTEIVPKGAAGAAAATASPHAAAGRATAACIAAPAGRTALRLCPTCKLSLVSQGGISKLYMWGGRPGVSAEASLQIEAEEKAGSCCPEVAKARYQFSAMLSKLSLQSCLQQSPPVKRAYF